ncbi:MAG: carbon-nitrogen hydrolase family protein [Acidobacteriota bacterium]
MAPRSLSVALLSEVFHGPGASDRLVQRFRDARSGGAELVLLPELPLQPWSPATREVNDADAEPKDGPRERTLAHAASEVGIAVIGGTIARDPRGRRNRALAVDHTGRVVGSYDKLHVPQEPGFWEADHYDEGDEPPRAMASFPLRVGVQICSDVNRPEGMHILSAQGAEAILVPRASEPATFDRWRLVFRANAMTSCAYVLSVNRPCPEGGAPIGGPSIAVGPDGDVILETMEALAVVKLEAEVVARARADYPGYLAVRSEVYARGWTLRGD